MISLERAEFAYDRLGQDRASLRRSLSNRLIYSMGKDPITATTRDWFNTTAYAVRERLIERWMETMRSYYRADAKRVYYLSMEFLTGRLLSNSLMNMGVYEECRDALADLELNIDDIHDIEGDAALGNGGLGRMVSHTGTTIDSVPISDATRQLRVVPLDNGFVGTARALGISFGD